MSTKIWEAFKIPADKSFQLLNDISECCYKYIDETSIGMIKFLVPIILDPTKWKVVPETVTQELILEKYDAIFKIIKESHLKNYNVTLNFAAGVKLYFYDNNIYMTHWGLDGLFHTFFKKKKYQEYFYWNNVDRPKNISQERWDARGEEWDAVFNANQDTAFPITFVGYDSDNRDNPVMERFIHLRQGLEHKDIDFNNIDLPYIIKLLTIKNPTAVDKMSWWFLFDKKAVSNMKKRWTPKKKSAIKA